MELTPATPAREDAPQAVVSFHPFGHDRTVHVARLAPGETLEAYFARVGVLEKMAGRPMLVRVNGARVPREMWRFTRPRPGQLIEVQAVVQGRGGAQKVVGAILMIVGAYAQQPWLFDLGSKLYASGWLTSISGWLSRRRDLTDSRVKAVSPTYSLTGGTNQARPYQPMSVVLGTHRVVPDYATRPYTEFEGDDQFLYCIFHFGLDSPGYTVTDIKIGDTPIESYSEVTTEWGDATGHVDLVAGNVDTIAGAALPFAAGFILRTSSVDTVKLAIDIEGLLFFQGDKGIEPRTASIEAQYRLVGSGTWLPFFTNGFAIATSYWSRGWLQGGLWVQYDIDTNLSPTAHTEGEPAGTVQIGGDSGGLQNLVWSYRTYAEAAANNWGTPWPVYPAADASLFEFTNGESKPIRRTFTRSVPQGQYEVRVRRGNPDETDQRAVSQLSWAVLRSYQVDNNDYTGQKRLALKIKASGQLSGTLDTLNAIARRPTWVDVTGSGGWELRQTGNPAWWFEFVAKGITVGNRLIFGMGLTASQIDYAALRAWAAWCDAKGLTFNGVIDTDRSNGELLDLICQAGYASKTWVTGSLGVVWDAENLPVTGVVNMANVIAGSMRVYYSTVSPPDEIVGVFLNAANAYAQEEVRKRLPGVTTVRKVERIELLGVTDAVSAGRFINLRAASYLYRAKFIEWEQDAEGTINRRGDVVALSHDLTQWGYSGRLVSLSGAAAGSTLVLDRRVPANLAAVNDEWIGIRVPGETGYRVLRVQCVPAGANNDNDTLTLVDAWPVGVPLPGATRPAVDYLWVYDFKATPGYRVKILDYIPRTRGDGTITVQLRGVPDGPEFYNAASGTFDRVIPQTLLDVTPVISDLVITEELKPQGNTWVVELTATWACNSAYSAAEVTGAPALTKLRTLGRTENGVRRFTWTAYLDETWTIYVQPFNALGQPGLPLTATYTVLGLAAPPSNVSGLTSELTTNGILLKWDESVDSDYAATELRVGASWAAGTIITRKSARTHLWGWQLAGAFTVWAKHIDTTGNESAVAQSIVVSVNPPATPSLQATVIANNVLLTWSDAKTTQPIKQYRFKVGNTFAGASDLGSAGGDSRFETYFFASPGAKRIWVQAEDVAGNLGGANSVDVTVTNALGFKLRADFLSTFAGTKTNALVEADGSLRLPVDTTETWATHFSSRSWSTISAQVGAGYPLYAQPNPASGTYQEVFDFGSVLTAAATLTATFGLEWLAGSGSVSVQFDVSATSATGPWTALAAGPNITTDVDFRWVRITLTVTGDGGTNDLARLTALNVRISQQKLTESGLVSCVSTDAGGTTYTFTEVFSGVASIQGTPVGTTDRKCVVDFNYSSSNPTTCKVLLFDNAGNRVSGNVSLYIEGFQ